MKMVTQVHMILVQVMMMMMKTLKPLPNPDPEVLRLAHLAPPPDPLGHLDLDPVQAPDPGLDPVVTREDGLGQGNG